MFTVQGNELNIWRPCLPTRTSQVTGTKKTKS